jgi:hypothetical protein
MTFTKFPHFIFLKGSMFTQRRCGKMKRGNVPPYPARGVIAERVERKENTGLGVEVCMNRTGREG